MTKQVYDIEIIFRWIDKDILSDMFSENQPCRE